MMERIADALPKSKARITGLVYLLYFLAAIFGQSMISRVVVSGDAAITANNLLAHQSVFRWGFAISLAGTVLYVALTALLYRLLKPVNNSVALAATFFSLVGCAVQASGYVLQLASMAVLGGRPYLGTFKIEQLQSLAMLFLNLNTQATFICLVFFGVFDFLIGYLIFRSIFLPRILGVLMAIAGLAWLTCLSPPLAIYLSPSIEVLGFAGEAVLLLWLLIEGVNERRWKEQTRNCLNAPCDICESVIG
jgi:hypothetical protein